jgi:enoyl-CoA hydratase/carnithine racemase
MEHIVPEPSGGEGLRIRRSGTVLWVVLDRPERMNAMNAGVLEGLLDAVSMSRREPTSAMVITGAGSAFCAGADLPWLRGLPPAEVESIFRRAARMLRELEELPFPVVAGVNGTCVAGGLELVCVCDLVVAAAGARFSDGHANYGLLPIAGSVGRLALRVGLSNAKRLCYTGEFVSADEALRMGLANWVVPDAELTSRLTQLAGELAAKSPAVLRRMKEAAFVAQRHLSSDMELQGALEHLRTNAEVVGEGLRAFAEKRPPRFS